MTEDDMRRDLKATDARADVAATRADTQAQRTDATSERVDVSDARQARIEARQDLSEGDSSLLHDQVDLSDTDIVRLKEQLARYDTSQRHHSLRTGLIVAWVTVMVAINLFGLYRTQQVAEDIKRFEEQTCENRLLARAYLRSTIAEEAQQAATWTTEDQIIQDATFALIICPQPRS